MRKNEFEINGEISARMEAVILFDPTVEIGSILKLCGQNSLLFADHICDCIPCVSKLRFLYHTL